MHEMTFDDTTDSTDLFLIGASPDEILFAKSLETLQGVINSIPMSAADRARIEAAIATVLNCAFEEED